MINIPFHKDFYKLSALICTILLSLQIIWIYQNSSKITSIAYWNSGIVKLMKKYPSITLKETKNTSISNNSSKIIHGQTVACKVPTLDPFQKDAMRVFGLKVQKPEKCEILKLSRLEGGTLTVDNKNGSIKSVTVEYIIRGRRRKANGEFDPPRGSTGILNDSKYKYSEVLNDDFHVHFSQPIQVQQNNKQFIMTPVERDFLRVTITMKTGGRKVEHQSHISNATETCRRNGKSMEKISERKKGFPYNVHMILVDAQSRGNIYRQTKRLIKTMEEDEDTMLFKGHSVQGDGTCCQVMATLAGYHYSMYKKDNPWQRPNKEVCDRIPLLFQHFQKAGYSVMFNDDMVWGAVFNYKLTGFIKPPADWYPRPFWMASHGMSTGCGASICICETQQMSAQLKHFTQTCKNEAKFSFNIWNLAHDDMNLLYVAENELIDIVNFFKAKERRKNTIFFMFGDHGPRYGARGNFRNTKQGRLEEYNPFYSIMLPPGFKKDHPEFYYNMKANTEVLTAHFDVHATLKHILSYPDLPEKHQYGQSLFTKIDPITRTCESAGVPEKNCFCVTSKSITTNTTLANDLSNVIVKHMNDLLSKDTKTSSLCVKLEPKTVSSIDQEDTVNGRAWTIILQVSPSNATFDVRVVAKQDKLIVDPDISRTNAYGEQPNCIAAEYPQLAFFCYCKSHLKKEQ